MEASPLSPHSILSCTSHLKRCAGRHSSSCRVPVKRSVYIPADCMFFGTAIQCPGADYTPSSCTVQIQTQADIAQLITRLRTHAPSRLATHLSPFQGYLQQRGSCQAEHRHLPRETWPNWRWYTRSKQLKPFEPLPGHKMHPYRNGCYGEQQPCPYRTSLPSRCRRRQPCSRQRTQRVLRIDQGHDRSLCNHLYLRVRIDHTSHKA